MDTISIGTLRLKPGSECEPAWNTNDPRGGCGVFLAGAGWWEQPDPPPADGELEHIGGILRRVVRELAKNSTESSESARGLPRHFEGMSGAEAEALGGIFSPSEVEGHGS
jgi:hypothetical protein